MSRNRVKEKKEKKLYSLTPRSIHQGTKASLPFCCSTRGVGLAWKECCCHVSMSSSGGTRASIYMITLTLLGLPILHGRRAQSPISLLHLHDSQRVTAMNHLQRTTITSPGFPTALRGSNSSPLSSVTMVFLTTLCTNYPK